MPRLGDDTQEWEKHAGTADKAPEKDASLDSEKRHYLSSGYSVDVTFWHGKAAVVYITKTDGSPISPSEMAKVLRANAGSSSWGRETSTTEHLEWNRQDQAVFGWYAFARRSLMVASREYAHALHAHNEAAIVAPAAGSLSRGEWRERLKKYCTIPSGHQLLTDQKRLFCGDGQA